MNRLVLWTLAYVAMSVVPSCRELMPCTQIQRWLSAGQTDSLALLLESITADDDRRVVASCLIRAEGGLRDSINLPLLGAIVRSCNTGVTDALADSAIVSQNLTFRRNVLFLINGEVLRSGDRRCPPLDPRRLTVGDLMIESIADTGIISDVRLKGHGGSDERLARYGDHALLMTGALIQVPEILELLMHNLEVTAESGTQSDLRDLSVRIGDWWRRNRGRVGWDLDRSAFVLALGR